jgi:hypothetical protein
MLDSLGQDWYKRDSFGAAEKKAAQGAEKKLKKDVDIEGWFEYSHFSCRNGKRSGDGSGSGL